jgi:hypothetical protein
MNQLFRFIGDLLISSVTEIWFVDPPKGNTRARRDESNLPDVRAQYAGRNT